MVGHVFSEIEAMHKSLVADPTEMRPLLTVLLGSTSHPSGSIFSQDENQALKVQSGQIGSAWEWYHWIGLEKDIIHYRLFFYFRSWIFDKSSKFWAALCKKWIQPPACSDHGLHRILSSYWLAHFYLMKKPANVLLYFWFGLGDVGILYSWAK